MSRSTSRVGTDGGALARATIAKLDARLIPLLLVAYVVNFLDRMNVGFAALRMNADLGFDPAVFGLGAGIFFVGYVLCEVPSNWVLGRVGARWWLARIMLSWGLVSAATAFVATPAQFYAVRFLLGVAEAGFVPALLVYLATWYPAAYRATAVAKVWSATAIALVIGGPLSAALLSLDGVWGLAGWQWLFVLEALPALLLAPILIRRLTDAPAQAAWLTGPERAWLAGELAREQEQRVGDAAPTRFADAFAVPRVWLLGLLYACLGVGFFGLTFWLPQVVAQLSGQGAIATSLLSALPFAAATAAMIAASRYADRHGGYARLVAGGAAVAAVGFGLSGRVVEPGLAFAALCIGAIGLWSVIGIFWQLPGRLLTGAAAAAGVAIVNACGSVGGFAGPYAVGLIRQQGGGFSGALLLIAGALLAAAVLAAYADRTFPRERD